MDSKRPQWFRVEKSLALGPGFHGLSCEAKWLWIIILSLVCEQNGQAIRWNSNYIQAITSIKPKDQDAAIEIFEKFVRLRVSRTKSCDTRTNSHATRRDETNETNNSCSSSIRFEFDLIYQKYPRKLGKQKGMSLCKAQIKTQDDFVDLSTAVDNYCKYLQANKTEDKYVKHFSTFMASWRDWLDPLAGQVHIKSSHDDVLKQIDEELARGGIHV
jgi:hypothetical protein